MSQVLSTRPIGTVSVYGCGGGGVNIAKEYVTDGHTGDIAKIDVAFLDTSDSNLADDLVDKAFLFRNPNGDTDGSGKIKAANAELIERSIPEVLRKFPAKDLNIIVTTASGGTGNVAAYHLLRNLIEAGQKAVIVLIGSAENEKTAKNTIGTLASLQNVVNEFQKPVIFHWGFNEAGAPRSAVDKEAHLIITSLCVLASRRNHGLDTADLNSLFNYTLPRPDIAPALARIRVFDTAAEFDKTIDEPIAAAYLKRSADDPQPKAFAPYSCDGFLPDQVLTNHEGLFFGIESKSLHKISADMESIRKDLESREQTRTAAPVFGAGRSTATASGLVLD